MGDRCYLTMKFRLADEARVKEVVSRYTDGFRWGERQVTDATVEIEELGANFAWYEERQELAEKGVAFIGEHAEGGEYSGYGFVSDGTEMVEMPMDREGHFVVPARWNADEQRVELDEDQRNLAEVFFRMRERVERLLSEDTASGVTANMEARTA